MSKQNIINAKDGINTIKNSKIIKDINNF